MTMTQKQVDLFVDMAYKAVNEFLRQNSAEMKLAIVGLAKKDMPSFRDLESEVVYACIGKYGHAIERAAEKTVRRLATTPVDASTLIDVGDRVERRTQQRRQHVEWHGLTYDLTTGKLSRTYHYDTVHSGTDRRVQDRRTP